MTVHVSPSACDVFTSRVISSFNTAGFVGDARIKVRYHIIFASLCCNKWHRMQKILASQHLLHVVYAADVMLLHIAQIDKVTKDVLHCCQMLSLKSHRPRCC